MIAIAVFIAMLNAASAFSTAAAFRFNSNFLSSISFSERYFFSEFSFASSASVVYSSSKSSNSCCIWSEIAPNISEAMSDTNDMMLLTNSCVCAVRSAIISASASNASRSMSSFASWNCCSVIKPCSYCDSISCIRMLRRFLSWFASVSRAALICSSVLFSLFRIAIAAFSASLMRISAASVASSMTCDECCFSNSRKSAFNFSLTAKIFSARNCSFFSDCSIFAISNFACSANTSLRVSYRYSPPNDSANAMSFCKRNCASSFCCSRSFAASSSLTFAISFWRCCSSDSRNAISAADLPFTAAILRSKSKFIFAISLSEPSCIN